MRVNGSSAVAFILYNRLPLLHEIRLEGAGAAGETDLLPPTLSVQYHFNPNGRARPYIGAGLNYTLFSDERTWGALQGAAKLAGSIGRPGRAARSGLIRTRSV